MPGAVGTLDVHGNAAAIAGVPFKGCTELSLRHMSCSLNSSRGRYMGEYIGDYYRGY